MKIYAACIRAAGSKNVEAGTVHGGIYFPAHELKGKKISARWEGNFFVNHLGYTDSQGVEHEPSNDLIRLTAWNGRNAAAGKGLADVFAKLIGVGKEISCDLRLNQYMKRLVLNGVPQAMQDGTPITYPGYNFTVIGDILWGADSANLVANEIAQWANYKQASFFSRPPFWNVPNTEDAATWKAIITARMAHLYDGSGTYGYARVMIPEGAVLLNAAAPAPMQQPAPQQQMMQPTPQPAATTGQPDMASMMAMVAQLMAAQGVAPGGVSQIAPLATPAPLEAPLGSLPTTGRTMPMTIGANTMTAGTDATQIMDTPI